MFSRGAKIPLIAALLVSLAAKPVFSVTEACSRNPLRCQVLELCAVIGNGKYSDRYPKHARRLADMGFKCGSGSKTRGNSGGTTKSTQPISVIQAAFSELATFERKTIQRFLGDRGHYTSAIDGLFGLNTRKALEAYSREIGGYDLLKLSDAERLVKKILVLAASQQESDAVEYGDPSIYPDLIKGGFGTGFFVSREGHVVTNYHVVSGCEKIKTQLNGVELEAFVSANDPLNDLALLRFQHNPEHVFALSESSPYPLQEVVVVGFPFGEQISSTAKFTRGVVSSLAGVANNFSQIQVDAAMQPGNSGGPILDEYGNVLAVAVSKLSLKSTIEAYGVVPENTNFGIKSSIVKNLLESNSISEAQENEKKPTPREIGEIASRGVVMLSCWVPRGN